MKYRDYEIRFTPTQGDSRPTVDIIHPQGEVIISILGGSSRSDIEDYQEYIDALIKTKGE